MSITEEYASTIEMLCGQNHCPQHRAFVEKCFSWGYEAGERKAAELKDELKRSSKALLREARSALDGMEAEDWLMGPGTQYDSLKSAIDAAEAKGW